MAGIMAALVLACPGLWAQADDTAEALAKEVAGKGWLVYGARSEMNSWDLFVSRPDGSQRRNITKTLDVEEMAPRFSPDGKKLLYRRMPPKSTIDHDKWGFEGQLVVANADGSDPKILGEQLEYPWASWSPDGTQISCLTKKGIKIYNLADLSVARELPRQGIYQQLFWSPDGKWFCGVGNNHGESWTVVRMNAETGDVNPVRSYQNCTPDWIDSGHIILSSRPAGQTGGGGYGYTQLWMVSGDGSEQKLLYGEDGSHLYGGCCSPDGQYVLFTKGPRDGSGAEKDGAPMGIIRMADTPMITGASEELRKLHPNAKNCPVLMLETAWEPHWTYAEIGGGN